MSQPQRAALFACFWLGLLAGFGTDALARPARSRRAAALRCGLLVAVGLPVLVTLNGCANPHPFLDVSRVVLVLPAAVFAIALLATWFPKRVLWGILLVCLVFAEVWMWNRRCMPNLYSGRRAELPGDCAYLKEERSLWGDNARGTDKHTNWGLYDLEPAINGYDPLHIARVRDVLCAKLLEDEPRRHVQHKEVTVFSQRGNLFLKRAFWLARAYVRGPLPDKGYLFPAATTVFLPQPPAGIAVPEVERADQLAQPMSPDVITIPYGGPASAKPRGARNRSAGRALQPVWDGPAVTGSLAPKPDPKNPKIHRLTLPQVRLPDKHAALRLAVTSDAWVRVTPTIRDLSADRYELGHSHSVPPARKREPHTWHIMLPDFREAEIDLEFRFKNKPGKIEIRQASVVADLSDEDDLIEVLSRTMNSVEVRVADLPGPRILTFLDADYPGWQAFVDGERSEILLANDVFKAVELAAGTHTVRFVFCSWRVLGALVVSAFAFLAVMVYLVWASISHRRALRA